MNAHVNSRLWVGAIAYLGICGLSQAQAAEKPLTQCFYSGPLGQMVIHASDPPARLDLDADGRGVKFIHNVQTNYDANNPFKAPVLAEKATCRLKLDCIAAKDGLKRIGVFAVNSGMAGDSNVWVQIGSPVDFKYADESRDKSCHVTGVELL
jgi:hypothetical protein